MDEKDKVVTSTAPQAKPVHVATPMTAKEQAASDPDFGEVLRPVPAVDEANPLDEETVTVRVKSGAPSFWNQNVLRNPGDPDFQMPISQAVNASKYVDEVRADGSLGSVPASRLIKAAEPVDRRADLAAREQQLRAQLEQVQKELQSSDVVEPKK